MLPWKVTLRSYRFYWMQGQRSTLKKRSESDIYKFSCLSLLFLLYSMKICHFWRVFSNDFISGNEKLCKHLYNLHMLFWYNFQYVHIKAYCKFPILHNCLISWFPFCIKLQEYNILNAEYLSYFWLVYMCLKNKSKILKSAISPGY